MERMRAPLRFIIKGIGVVAHGGIALAIVLLVFAGYWMQVDDKPFKADYILPLAGDSHRFFKAAELFHAGYAPAILISNAKVEPPSRLDRLLWKMGYPNYSESEYRARFFEELGLSAARLEPFGNGHISTVEEAEALRDYLSGRTVRLLLVTSPYHARRAKMIFRDILPQSSIRVVTNQEGSFDNKWWEDQKQAQHLVMEFAKTIHYLLGGVFRSTDAQ